MSDERDRPPAPRADIYVALSQLDDASFAYVVGVLQGTIAPLGDVDAAAGLRELRRVLDCYIVKRGEHGRGSAAEQTGSAAHGDPAGIPRAGDVGLDGPAPTN